MSRRDDGIGRLCRQSEAVLASLDLPAIFTLAQLHDRVQRRRGRPVHLIPHRMPYRSPCGVWLGAADDDYVLYDASCGPLYQRALIAHEFGHMLFDDAAAADLNELVGLLMPDIDPSAITRIMSRTRYEEYRERRAEVFGSIVVGRTGRWGDAPTPSGSDPAVLARMAAALEVARR